MKLIIGDWSKDGHNQSDAIIFCTNYPVEVVRQAYKDSCKLTGLQFNHNEDYTGLGVGRKYGSWRLMVTEYEKSGLDTEALEALNGYGIDTEEYEENQSNENFANLWWDFVKLSLPDLKVSNLSDDIPNINGYWNEDLNVQFGYGLYY